MLKARSSDYMKIASRTLQNFPYAHGTKKTSRTLLDFSIQVFHAYLNTVNNKGKLFGDSYMGKHVRLKTMLSLLVVIVLVTSIGNVYAGAPNPTTPATAAVDGDPSEWNLTVDFFANMYRAFNETKQLQSKLYLRYDPTTETLYVLVLTEPDYPGLRLTADAWFDVYVSTESDMPGKELTGGSASFAWVEFDPVVSNVEGFEGSFHLSVGEYMMKAHIQVNDEGEGSQTSGTLKAGLNLFVVPEGTTLIVMLSGFAAFGLFAYKRRKK